MTLCAGGPGCTLGGPFPAPTAIESSQGDLLSSYDRSGLTPEQNERLQKIHARLIEARRELDALIGDAYLRPRASIVPVHFLDLAAAVEKLRWAEKEWRELDREIAEKEQELGPPTERAFDPVQLMDAVGAETGG